MHDRPKMPTEGIYFHVNVDDIRVKLDYDGERFSSGSMRMRLEGTNAKVKDGDTVIGEIYAPLGGGLGMEVGGRSYFIGMEVLWTLAQRIDKAYKETPCETPDAPPT